MPCVRKPEKWVGFPPLLLLPPRSYKAHAPAASPREELGVKGVNSAPGSRLFYTNNLRILLTSTFLVFYRISAVPHIAAYPSVTLSAPDTAKISSGREHQSGYQRRSGICIWGGAGKPSFLTTQRPATTVVWLPRSRVSLFDCFGAFSRRQFEGIRRMRVIICLASTATTNSCCKGNRLGWLANQRWDTRRKGKHA